MTIRTLAVCLLAVHSTEKRKCHILINFDISQLCVFFLGKSAWAAVLKESHDAVMHRRPGAKIWISVGGGDATFNFSLFFDKPYASRTFGIYDSCHMGQIAVTFASFFKSLMFVGIHCHTVYRWVRAALFFFFFFNLLWSKKERRAYGIRTTAGWVNDDLIFIFGWTTPKVPVVIDAIYTEWNSIFLDWLYLFICLFALNTFCALFPLSSLIFLFKINAYWTWYMMGKGQWKGSETDGFKLSLIQSKAKSTRLGFLL